MKKTLLAIATALLATTASAANFVSVDVDRVEDSKGAVSQAQYFRAGKDMAGLNLGLQVRTAVFDKGGMLNSVEGTVGRDFKLGGQGFNGFVGLGHDNAFNGAAGKSFQYGLVGVSTGAKMGPVWGFGGVKTRVNWDSANPKQTVGFAGVSYPVAKDVSVGLSASKSWGDIKETAYGVGVRVAF